MDHFIPSFTWLGFSIGPLYVYSWGLTASLGSALTVYLAFRQKKKTRNFPLSDDDFWNLCILIIVSIFLGARIFYVLEDFSYYRFEPLRFLKLWEGGFSFFGGALFGLLAGFIWSKRKQIDFLSLAGIFTPAWIFGLAIGRIGCFFIHDHLGKTTDWPWGIFLEGQFRHEPALYEALILFLIGTFLLYLRKKRKLAKSIFLLSLSFYTFFRFWLDFLRESDQNGGDDRFFSLTLAQWISVLIFFFCLRVLKKTGFFNFRQNHEKPTGTAEKRIENS